MEFERDHGEDLQQRLEIHGRKLGFGWVLLILLKMLLVLMMQQLVLFVDLKLKLISLYLLLIIYLHILTIISSTKASTLTIPLSIPGYTLRTTH